MNLISSNFINLLPTYLPTYLITEPCTTQPKLFFIRPFIFTHGGGLTHTFYHGQKPKWLMFFLLFLTQHWQKIWQKKCFCGRWGVPSFWTLKGRFNQKLIAHDWQWSLISNESFIEWQFKTANRSTNLWIFVENEFELKLRPVSYLKN